jgi:hypothetical protein
MRASEIHRAANEILDGPPSVKSALSGYTSGGDRHFNRVRRRVYEMPSNPLLTELLCDEPRRTGCAGTICRLPRDERAWARGVPTELD